MKHIGKQHNLSIVFSILFALFSIVGCTDQYPTKQSDNRLYEYMISYSRHYSELQGATRSSDLTLDTFEESIELSEIDPKYLEYLDYYCEPDNVFEWDEEDVLSLIDNDSRFTEEEKTKFAEVIAGVYYQKEELEGLVEDIDSSNDAEKDCEEDFYRGMKRATRNYAIALVAAAFEPTVLGELAATTYYYLAIDDLQEDYNICMERARNSNSDCSIVDFYSGGDDDPIEGGVFYIDDDDVDDNGENDGPGDGDIVDVDDEEDDANRPGDEDIIDVDDEEDDGWEEDVEVDDEP